MTRLKDQLRHVKPTPTNMLRAVLQASKKPLSYDQILIAIDQAYDVVLTRQQLYQLIARELKAEHVFKQRIGMLVLIGWVDK